MPSSCCSHFPSINLNNFFYEDYFTTECLIIGFFKLIGYLIIVASSIIKLPQIIKILKARNSAGLSFSGCLLELFAITFNASYSYAQSYPFSSWGEALFLLIETLFIAFLILWYNNKKFNAIIFFTLFSSLVFILMGGFIEKYYFWYLQIINGPLAVLGKLLQIKLNYENKHTGQLSLITSTLLFGGCILRILTSIKETGDQAIILTYVIASFANFGILAQILIYWNSTNQHLKKEVNKKTN